MYYNAKIKNIENKIPDIINLTINNDKINEVKHKIPKITNLATTSTLTAMENKILNVSNLVKKLTITQKFVKLKKKKNYIITQDNTKYITTPEFNKLTFCCTISTSKFSKRK